MLSENARDISDQVSSPAQSIMGCCLLQAKSQEVRGNKDFVATPWVSSSDEVEAAAKTANSATPDQTLKPTEYEGKLRKTTCNSFGMGMKVSAILHFDAPVCIWKPLLTPFDYAVSNI